MDRQPWLLPYSGGAQFDGMSSQTMRVLAKRLAAYLPITAVRQLLQGSLPAPSTAVWENAATMFTDMTGFTQMAEALAVAGPQGAEELNRVLLMTFTSLINAIHDAGGAVVHFHGDAMLIYFPDEDGRAAQRALACAGFMQNLMQKNLAQISVTHSAVGQADFALGIKIGVSYGRCCQVIVGDPEKSLEFVLGGTAVDEAVLAQQQAVSGEIVAAKAALQQTSLSCAEEYRVVNEIAPVPYTRELLHWHAYSAESLKRLLHIAPNFLPDTLVDRLQSQTTLFIAGHRSVTSMFVQFDGIDFTNGLVGQHLQDYYLWAVAVVTKYAPQNGRVNRLLTGDKGNVLHILFGAPIAPDSPEQAVRCALAFQREKPSYISAQRIGMATGAVFATAVGSQNRREYTTVGTIVNISAYLTQHCPPGEVVLNEQTARRIWHLFEFDPLPPLILKGHEQSVSVYSVAQESVVQTSVAARFARWQKPPLGREEERAQLNQKIEAALQREGGLVAISGPFGGGTRPLLAEGVRQWLAADGVVLAGLSQPHLLDVPFSPWQSIWRDFFGINNRLATEVQATAVEEAVRQLIPNWADETPLLLAAMGLPVAGDRAATISPSVRQIWLFTLIQRCFAHSANSKPLMIIIEDVHWSDQASLDLVAELAASAVELPLLLAITFRPSENFHFPILNHPACTIISLPDWSVAQARQIANRRLGTLQLPGLIEQRLGLLDQHGREAESVNPLFLDETLKIMLSLDVLQFAEGKDGRVTVDEEKLAKLQLPDTITTLLQARLDAIPSSAYSFLQLASVVGREFSLPFLVNINKQITWAEAVDRIETLIELDLIQPTTDGTDSKYMFQHTLLHEVVYQSLPYARRQAIHLTIAETLRQTYQDNLTLVNALLAHHYARANQTDESFRFALAAADEAAAIFANRSAADLYQQAFRHLQVLGVHTQPDTAVRILSALADAHQRLGEYVAAENALTQARSIILNSNRVELLFIDNKLAETKLAQGRFVEAEMLARAKVNKSTMQASPVELARAFLLIGQAALARFELERADDELRKARMILLKEPDAALMPVVLENLGIVRFCLHAFKRADALCRQAVELAQQFEQPTLLGKTMLTLAQLSYLCGQVDDSLRLANEAVELVRTTSPNLMAALHLHRAKVYLYNGRFSEAFNSLEQADELYARMDDHVGRFRLYLLWGRRYYPGISEWELALTYLDKARQQLAKLQRIGGTAVVESIHLRFGLAQIALHTNQLTQAETLLVEVESELAGIDLDYWKPELLYWQSKGHIAQNKTQRAREALLTAERLAANQNSPELLPLILLDLALLFPEDDKRHWQYLEKCVSAATVRARVMDKLYCLKVAGQKLVQSSDSRLNQIGVDCLTVVQQQQS